MQSTQSIDVNFSDFDLNKAVLGALEKAGYEKPSPIQAQAIPALLEGHDVIGQAQTGTGKTAAFALPILTKIDLTLKEPQALILTPTRELALQVCDNIKRYGANMNKLEVLPIYGGQSYLLQKQALRKGVPIVVGTPGRVMDLIEQKCLDLSSISYLVLDEADEMLNMGFLEDVEWILKHTPESRQTVLFSATMPKPIQAVAKQYLRDPLNIAIKAKTATAQNIHQCAVFLKHAHKMNALVRILEAEPYEACIIFARTISSTIEIAEQLESMGFEASALNGDMVQKQRERTIQGLKSGKINIIVATDVAARGIDVSRVTHVINYDMPQNPEAYIHRIGRTGRAGRSGKAILFVLNHEKRHLNSIERLTKQKIDIMPIPSNQVIEAKRMMQFKDSITSSLNKESTLFSKVIQEICEEKQVSPMQVASALAHLVQDAKKVAKLEPIETIHHERDRSEKPKRDRKPRSKGMEEGMQRYRIEVGRKDNVTPSNIVGAIANELSLDSRFIGSIKLFDKFSTVDLPEDLPPKAIHILEKTWVAGRQMKIKLDTPPQNAWDDAPFEKKGKRPLKGKRKPERRKGAH